MLSRRQIEMDMYTRLFAQSSSGAVLTVALQPLNEGLEAAGEMGRVADPGLRQRTSEEGVTTLPRMGGIAFLAESDRCGSLGDTLPPLDSRMLSMFTYKFFCRCSVLLEFAYGIIFARSKLGI